MWPWYGVHINLSVCMALFCTLSAINWAIPASNRYRDLFLLFFDWHCSTNQQILLCMLPTHSQLICHPSTCANEWRPKSSTLCPLNPHRNALVKSLGYAWSSNGPSPWNFLTVSGYFECYMYRVMVLGWLKKEDEQFWLVSTVSGLPL